MLAVLAGWLPWLGFQGRTIFTFYAVVFVPFLCIALAMSLGHDARPGRRHSAPTRDRRSGRRLVPSCSPPRLAWFFYPIWTGEVIPYSAWHIRMWFPTWV